MGGDPIGRGVPLRRSEQRSGLRVRLLALVLVPTVIASFMAGGTAVDKRDEADVAVVIDQQVGTLTHLVDLRTALTSARIPIEVEVRSAALGLNTSEGFKLLKLDNSDFGNLDEVKTKLT